MTIEGITCDKCGSSEVTEFKPNTYVCASCEHIFKYVDPTHSSVEVDVAPQFCEEGCGNPIKYKCALCGKMVCEGHGEKAKVLLARRAFAEKGSQDGFSITLVGDLQQAWCIGCFEDMSDEDKTAYMALILKDADIYVRIHGVHALRNMGNPAARGVPAHSTPHLVAALKDSEPRVRAEAVGSFRVTGDKAAVPYVLKALTDSDPLVRIKAINALGKIGDPSVVTRVLETLKDGDVSLQRGVVRRSIEEIVDSSSIPILMSYADDKFYIVEEHGDKSTYTVRVYTVRETAVKALASLGDASIPYLIRLLNSSHSDVRSMAIEALGDLRSKEAVPHLIKALRDKEVGYFTSVRALRIIGDPKGVRAARRYQIWKQGHL